MHQANKCNNQSETCSVVYRMCTEGYIQKIIDFRCLFVVAFKYEDLIFISFTDIKISSFSSPSWWSESFIIEYLLILMQYLQFLFAHCTIHVHRSY